MGSQQRITISLPAFFRKSMYLVLWQVLRHWKPSIMASRQLSGKSATKHMFAWKNVWIVYVTFLEIANMNNWFAAAPSRLQHHYYFVKTVHNNFTAGSRNFTPSIIAASQLSTDFTPWIFYWKTVQVASQQVLEKFKIKCKCTCKRKRQYSSKCERLQLHVWKFALSSSEVSKTRRCSSAQTQITSWLWS